MTSRLFSCVVVAACWLTLATARSGENDRVSIHVAVGGGDDGSRGALSKDDFELSIDGRPTTIASLTPPPTPLTIILLLDRTISMETYGDIEDEVVDGFVPALRLFDRARIGGIANRLALAPAFSSSPRDIIAAARRALSFRKEDRTGPSPVWDALDRAIEVLEAENGLRAILLVSDGRATGNRSSASAVGDRAVSSGIVVDVLSEALPMILRQNETTAARVRPGLALQGIAQATGGLIVPADPTPSTQLPPAGPSLAGFVSDLRGMYTIEVAAAGPPGSVHRIDVKIKRAGLTARTRLAYRTR